jgi:hypothetical protein
VTAASHLWPGLEEPGLWKNMERAEEAAERSSWKSVALGRGKIERRPD